MRVVRRASAVALVLTALAGSARAEVGATASVSSDYRYRGVSLSDERAAAGLNLSYDDPSGAYLGVQIIATQAPGRSLRVADRMHYAGLARRLTPRTSLDLGAINYNLTSYGGRKRVVDYSEVYAGVVSERFNAHLHYAPDYYQLGLRTLYADLGASARPVSFVRLFAHAGGLIPVGGRTFPRSRKVHYDLSAGGALDVGAAELSLTWSRLDPTYAPRSVGGQRGERVSVAIAYVF